MLWFDILMEEGNRRIIIESSIFYLPRACLIKIESEALVSTRDFPHVPNQPYLGKSLLRNSKLQNIHLVNNWLFRQCFFHSRRASRISSFPFSAFAVIAISSRISIPSPFWISIPSPFSAAWPTSSPLPTPVAATRPRFWSKGKKVCFFIF